MDSPMQYEIFHFPGIDSTNNWILSNTHLLPKNKISLVYANKQSAGRGRNRNHWHSPVGCNLYATFGVFTPLTEGIRTHFPLLMAISAVDMMEKMNLSPQIKWPNDLIINQKKIAGILTETSIEESSILHAIGIGVNINMTKEELQEINRPVTSISEELGHELEIKQVLDALKDSFSRYLETYLGHGFSSILPLFKAKLAHKENQPLSFHDRDQQWNGKFHSLNEDGTLNLELETGEIKRFLSGEVQE
jgi:BirA family transcriptional regulator, biotin operon repressor / biotin---[acetyl-CoA-carboxylase] ligase